MRNKIAKITGSRWLRPVLIWLLLYGLMFAMLVMVVTPERYDIKTGYPAPVTIFATKDVEDTYVTEKLRNEAAAAVDYSYGSIDSGITTKVVSDFGSACTAAITLHNSELTNIANLGEAQLAQIQAENGVPFTRSELAESGLGDLPVIDTGDNAPGVSLVNSSAEFLEKLRTADLVIAKGQGNFESLCDAPENGNIFFLFRVKCPVVEELTAAPAGSLQIRCGAPR